MKRFYGRWNILIILAFSRRLLASYLSVDGEREREREKPVGFALLARSYTGLIGEFGSAFIKQITGL
jgi:hypothetical protein